MHWGYAALQKPQRIAIRTGFERSAACMAMKMCHICLSGQSSAQWILEADIKACFDRISHEWMLSNVPLPKGILQQWLNCGYLEAATFHDTEQGTPQGGIISPILCNMALDGLQDIVVIGRSKKRRHLNFIRYAHDFIVTGASADYLQQEIFPDLQQFLSDRDTTASYMVGIVSVLALNVLTA